MTAFTKLFLLIYFTRHAMHQYYVQPTFVESLSIKSNSFCPLKSAQKSAVLFSTSQLMARTGSNKPLVKKLLEAWFPHRKTIKLC